MLNELVAASEVDGAFSGACHTRKCNLRRRASIYWGDLDDRVPARRVECAN